MKDENKSVLGWAANCGAKIMTLRMGMHMRVVTPIILNGESLLWREGQGLALGAGWFCILSLYKFTGQAEVQQHRVADTLGGGSRDRLSDLH